MNSRHILIFCIVFTVILLFLFMNNNNNNTSETILKTPITKEDDQKQQPQNDDVVVEKPASIQQIQKAIDKEDRNNPKFHEQNRRNDDPPPPPPPKDDQQQQLQLEVKIIDGENGWPQHPDGKTNEKRGGKTPPPMFLGVDSDVMIPTGAGCDDVLPDIPLSPLEEELRRLLIMTVDVLREKEYIGWPADGTLLGLIRNGRVATDRDIDYQIHATYQTCANILASLKPMFEKRTKIRMFKIVYGKYRGQKIGRYAMVRMPPRYGDFGTGVDFNCVYTDDPSGNYKMHVHKGTIETIPKEAYPLKLCLGYGMAIPCPSNPMAVLNMFAPRYDGCMLFPHCLGDPLRGGHKKCLSPHPPMKRQRFLDVVNKLDQCGWVSLAQHAKDELACDHMLKAGDSANMCQEVPGARWPMCFMQPYVG
jgi:hypothetical protein